MKRSFFLLGLLLAACSSPDDASIAEGVDTVFVNAKAYTLDASMPWAEALVVDGDLIVYVGDNEGAMALAGANTRQHDLDGQMLLPGFIDTHSHPIYGGGMAKSLSLDTGGTVEGWVSAIEDYAAANPDADVLFGYGFLATTFGPTGPQRQMIDGVVADRPVLIMDEGFHGAWVNTKALELLNITQDTADPTPGFAYYKRDENGDATGYLLETTALMAVGELDIFSAQTVTDGAAIIIDIMNSYGVTAAFDAGALDAESVLDNVLNDLEKRGDMTIRIIGSHFAEPSEDVSDVVDKAEHFAATVKGDKYHYNTLKIMDDGTVEGRTAAMFEDYQGEPGNSGETVFTEEQMITMIAGSAEKNIDVHIHALGERAVHETLNAIEVARERHPGTQSRFAICHIQVITDQDLPRFAELDVIAQSTPLWASYDEYGKQFVSEDQFNRMWRFNSLKELGVKLTFGSDFPASGAGTLGLSPVVQIEIGHTRQYPGQPDSPVGPLESERLDIDTLIRGFTIDGAYQLRMEDQIGSLEVGKKADLVVLDQNLFDVDAYAIHQTEVVMTMLGGDVVYDQ